MPWLNEIHSEWYGIYTCLMYRFFQGMITYPPIYNLQYFTQSQVASFKKLFEQDVLEQQRRTIKVAKLESSVI